jgi:sterol desaturase/sphingolipid hydroxylase (fatty acid hydroxylase superfamily)
VTERAESLSASPPIFKTRWLDRLTRASPAFPPLIFGPAIIALGGLTFTDHELFDALFACLGGYAFWTLCEYWAHRSVFHLEPKNKFGQRMHWMIHGVHHDHPDDRNRLVLPPIMSLPLAALFLALFVGVLGTPIAWGVCTGFYAGYLVYDMTHYALHHARPKSRIGKRLRELHMRHHFEDDERGFGVSAPWWDIVFGTYAYRKRSRG